jgi:hypothetical protein
MAKPKRGYDFIQDTIINYDIKKQDQLSTIVYSIKRKCEGPFQLKDIERAQISTDAEMTEYGQSAQVTLMPTLMYCSTAGQGAVFYCKSASQQCNVKESL